MRDEMNMNSHQLRHVVSNTLRRITRRYPWMRHATTTTSILTLLWLYALCVGERTTFRSHVDTCNWESWEEWPRDAQPHHLVLIADPQLVDPHTYPGRPWPLSSLTEIYTDNYMARNFRLINEKLDPDSIVFLGDLFDGGREWATERAKTLKTSQRQQLIDLLILDEGKKEGERMLSDGKTDLNKYVPGEKGRWSKWKMRQWKSELDRFGRIFYDSDQLYPNAERGLLPTIEAAHDPVAVANGAPNITWQHYASFGGKTRNMKTSLPGNHDVGIGSGVQVTVRDRFETHFGDANTVYVIANHTFVSLDVLSLSAYDEFVKSGEMNEARRNQYKHIWQPAHDFLNDLDVTGPKAAAEALNQLYPGSHPVQPHAHQVVDPKANAPKTHAVTKPKTKLPVVLLTHVPLYRNEGDECGSLRERGKIIPLSAGYQYQNLLTPTLTGLVAKKVSAAGDMVHAFSGDDHDYCDVSHRFNIGRWNEDEKKERVVMRSVREITVKSFSWAMGVRKPGFLLVSMWNPVDQNGRHLGECMDGASGTGCRTIQTHLCLLPDQLSIFLNYATLLGCTMVVLFLRAVVIGIRNLPMPEEDEVDGDSIKFGLPRYTSREKSNSRANGYSSPVKNLANGDKTGRQRASSTSTSHSSGNNQNLGVQRSYNARTRSVSPAVNGSYTPNNTNYVLPSSLADNSRPLVEKAGYFPQMRWQDPDESDEESHVGEDDSQAKSRGRKKPKSRARKALDEFLRSVLWVGVPCALWYGWLIKNG